jgi:predicted nucleotidyltransferase
MKNHISTYKNFILESRFYQSELNPSFWSDFKFDQDVRMKLLKIARDFYEDLDITIPVLDIQLTGSLANYNWTKYSDLDVHVIMDLSQINQDVELVKKALDGVRVSWNQRHSVVIRKHEVELYAQDINQLHLASGLFSLLKNEWIRQPQYNPPTVDEKDVTRKTLAYRHEIAELNKRLKAASPEEAETVLEYASALKKRISRARDEKLAHSGGEFSIENLVFKEMRNNGMYGELIQLKSDAYSKIYSE